MLYDVSQAIRVYTIDYEKGGLYYILSTDKDKYAPLSFNDKQDKGKFLENYLVLHHSWLNSLIKLDCVEEKDDKLNIFWSCMIPKDTPLKNSYWIELSKHEMAK